MMNKLAYLLVFIALTAPCAYGTESFLTGRQLLTYCQSEKPGEKSMCYGYIVGLTETEIFNETLCMDDTVTYQFTMDKSIAYLHNNPDILHESAAPNLTETLKAVYPCEHSEH